MVKIFDSHTAKAQGWIRVAGAPVEERPSGTASPERVHASGTSLSLLKDMVSKQPSPKFYTNSPSHMNHFRMVSLCLPALSYTNTSCEGFI